MLSVKLGSIKYHFLSLWYDSTRDWTQVSRAIGEHSNHYATEKYWDSKQQMDEIVHEKTWTSLRKKL